MITMRDQRVEVARQSARRLLHRFGVVAPEHIHIEAFCQRLGVRIVTVRLDGADAQLVRNGRCVTILISDRITDPVARRFNIAHELGHFLLGHPTRIPAQIPGPEAPRSSTIYEVEANAFASELLMPEWLVRSGCDLTRADLEVPQQIARNYNVSILASAIRFTELAKEPCAAVFSVASKTGGRVKWVAPSATFPQRIKRGKPLSPGSIASTFYDRGELDGQPHCVLPAAWFDVANNVRLIEHAICSVELRTVLSMLWVQNQNA